MPRLIHTESGATREIPLGDSALTVGRAATNTISTKDAKASREHFRLENAGGAWTVTDLGSTNGTRVNGTVIGAPTTLKKGDRIAIGQAEFVFRDDSGDTAVDLPAAGGSEDLVGTLRRHRDRLAAAGRLLAFLGILLAWTAPGLGVFAALLGIMMALLAAGL